MAHVLSSRQGPSVDLNELTTVKMTPRFLLAGSLTSRRSLMHAEKPFISFSLQSRKSACCSAPPPEPGRECAGIAC